MRNSQFPVSGKMLIAVTTVLPWRHMFESCQCNLFEDRAHEDFHVQMTDVQMSCRDFIDHVAGYQGPLLLTWFDFNPSMDK